MTEPRELKRRKEDQLDYKLSKIAGLIGSLVVIGGALFWLMSTRFVTKDTYELLGTRVSNNTTDILLLQKDVTYIRLTVTDIGSDIKEIKKAVK